MRAQAREQSSQNKARLRRRIVLCVFGLAAAYLIVMLVIIPRIEHYHGAV